MSPASVFNLAELGRPIEATLPFLVNDTGTVWFLSSGSVDLFVVRTVDGEAFSARHYLMSVAADGAIFGIDAGRDMDIAILACPRPGTTIHPIRFQAFLESISSDIGG